MHIICVRDQVLFDPYFRGQLRKEDIRSFEKDKVEVYKSYRPGDIVLAKVLSLGEASSGIEVILSTL
jgi:exosome complex component CSL4